MLELWHLKVNVPCLPYFHFLLKFTAIGILFISHLLFGPPVDLQKPENCQWSCFFIKGSLPHTFMAAQVKIQLENTISS